MDKILLGFEVPTGQPVYMSLHHTVVCGMTQLSGKTTALEAIINRSGLRAIAFKTKRGESGFNSYHEIPPFFQERADWRYVQSILEATMRERMKFERSWIIKASKGAKTLEDVYKNVIEQKQKARKDSLSESVYTVLEEYLKIVVPQIKKFGNNLSQELVLQDGINVMDLTPMSLEMRSLVIRSVMEHVSDNLNDVIIIVPEAWEYLPQGRSTPVKWFAETFIRKGAAIGNYLFVDSQDIAGIDKAPLRQCDNWIMGRQREIHEIDRLRDTIGKNFASEEEIRQLPLGTFFASIGNDLKKVYVLPVGIPEEMGVQVAKGEISSDVVKERLKSGRNGGDEVYKEMYEKEKKAREDLEKELDKAYAVITTNENISKKQIEGLEKEVQNNKEIIINQIKLEARMLEVDKKQKEVENEDAEIRRQVELLQKEVKAYDKLKEALAEIVGPVARIETVSSPGQPSIVELQAEQTVLNVIQIQRSLDVSTSNLLGRVSLLYSEGFFDEKEKSISDINKELNSKGWINNPQISEFLDDICRWGFLRKRKADRWLYIAAIKSTEAEKQGLLKRTVEVRT